MACDGHSNTLTLLSLFSHFATTFEVCLGSLSIWKTHLRPSLNLGCLEMLLQYIHIFFLPQDPIYFVKCTSPSCSKAPPQHDAATPMLHCWDGVLQLASLPLFHRNTMMVIMAKQLYFYFIRPEDISPKSTIFVHVQLQTVVWLFYGGFGAVASSLLNGLSVYVDIGLWILILLYLSSSIFTRSFAVVLGLTCTFRTKVHSSLGDRTRLLPERGDGCVVPWCLYLCTTVCTDEHGTFRRLEIAPKDEPDL